MGRHKKSIIWNLESEQLQTLLDTSDSIVDVLGKIGLDPYNGHHKVLHARIDRDGLSLQQLKKNRTVARAAHLSDIRRTPDEDMFCENSSCQRKNVKDRIIKSGMIEYKCVECGNKGEHNGKPLSLQLDHKNGINNDNRLENLRFLCPNCHSQTSTFAGKRLKKNKVYETEKQRNDRISATRKFNPSKDELASLVHQLPMTRVGKIFGVSDGAVRKRCKLLEVDWR
jgi:5-methylcytosine-specific restriction endonuclease McrA